MVWYFLLQVSVVLLEQLVLLTEKRIYRFITLALSFAIQSASLGYAIYYSPHLAISGALALLTLARVVSGFRLIAKRMHTGYLKQKLLRTQWILLALQYGVIASYIYFSTREVSGELVYKVWSVASLCISACLFLCTVLFVAKSRIRKASSHLSDKELPTLSVLIPARNETEDLPACLRSLLANDYPKLEVLVLDDCSVDGTAEVIKEFAHDGVRFISSDASSTIWLPKNRAYQTLFEAASGEILLFAGVDVRFGPDSLRGLVNTMQDKKIDMLCMVPRRSSANPAHVLYQTMRYFWEFAVPRTRSRAAVLSTGWLIRKKVLKKVGGFEAARRMIVPESYISRAVASRGLHYVCMRSNEHTYLETVKNVHEQRATAIRTRYPQLHRHLEWVVVLAVFEILFLIMPFALAIFVLTAGLLTYGWIWVASAALLVLTNVTIISVTNPANSLYGLLSFPLAVCLDIVTVVHSAYQYEFGKIDWKGRNICIPVMHVYPSLPPLQDKK